MVADIFIAFGKLHVTFLAFSRVGEVVVVRPSIFVPMSFASLAGENEDHGEFFGGRYSALFLPTVEVVEVFTFINFAFFQYLKRMRCFDDLKTEVFEKLDSFFRSAIGVDSLKRIAMLFTVCSSGNASYIVLLAIIKKGVFFKSLNFMLF